MTITGLSANGIVTLLAVCAVHMAIGNTTDSDAIFADAIFAPTVVAIPPASAVRDMCVAPDGEIRHYGRVLIKDKHHRAMIASRDNGLSWKTRLVPNTHVGPMVKSPYSGDWIYFKNTKDKGYCAVRSKIGPDDPAAEYIPLGWKSHGLRQLIALKSRKRWVAAFSDTRNTRDNCYNSSVAYSDDDGRSWKLAHIEPVPGIPRLNPGDKRPHWFNNGCEPAITELQDGSIWMAVRTSGETHYSYISRDGGETWSAPTPMKGFWSANTMPYFFRLRDGRLLFIWNNTALLPTRDLAEMPELSEGERNGTWEAVFTNRDALHAAISSDDGKTWSGFREIILNECRNAPDFRQLGHSLKQELDKSVHQTQAIELPNGKVMLALGQNSSSRRIVIFDPNWLYETSRTEDFINGLGSVSTHLYIKSLGGGAWPHRGWTGHCAWNRVSGAVIMREPEDSIAGDFRRESLFMARIPDPRLVSDVQGVAWNFPATKCGMVEIDFRNEGEGFRFTLADRWMNPCDEINPLRSPFTCVIGKDIAPAGSWRKLIATWDERANLVTVKVDNKVVATGQMNYIPEHGLSYLHLQTIAPKADFAGVYFRRFHAEATKCSN